MANWIVYFRQTEPHDDVVADMTRILTQYGLGVHNVNQPTIWPATELRQRAESGGGDWLVRVSDPKGGLTDEWLAALMLLHGFEFTARRAVLAHSPEPLQTRDSRLKDS
jgi:hypothetical protein